MRAWHASRHTLLAAKEESAAGDGYRLPGDVGASRLLPPRDPPPRRALACSRDEELLFSRNVERLQGGPVFKAQRLLYHSTIGSRVIKKKRTKSKQ